MTAKEKYGIIITTQMTEPYADHKASLTEKLCISLKNQNFYVVCSHSPIPSKIQEISDISLFDTDNRFSLFENACQSHGVAELTSVYNGIYCLLNKGFDRFSKITYDCDPRLNYFEKVKRNFETGKKFIASTYTETMINTIFYSSNIDFFIENFTLQDTKYMDIDMLEKLFFDICYKKSLFDFIHLEPTSDVGSSVGAAGKVIERYFE